MRFWSPTSSMPCSYGSISGYRVVIAINHTPRIFKEDLEREFTHCLRQATVSRSAAATAAIQYPSRKLPFLPYQRIILKRKATCQPCGSHHTCARFPIDDDRPDSGLGPWCCEPCWKKEMEKRRRHNKRQEDKLRILPWPKKTSIPLRITRQDRNIVAISGHDLFRLLGNTET